MPLSEEDLLAVAKVKRSRRLTPVFLLVMWVVGAILLTYRTSQILELTEPHGIADFAGLLSAAESIDENQAYFSRLDVLLLDEIDAMVTGAVFMFLITVFALSILPLARLVERLADSADGSLSGKEPDH